MLPSLAAVPHASRSLGPRSRRKCCSCEKWELGPIREVRLLPIWRDHRGRLRHTEAEGPRRSLGRRYAFEACRSDVKRPAAPVEAHASSKTGAAVAGTFPSPIIMNGPERLIGGGGKAFPFVHARRDRNRTGSGDEACWQAETRCCCSGCRSCSCCGRPRGGSVDCCSRSRREEREEKRAVQGA